MAHFPYGVRLLTGLAVVLTEETRKLPQTAITLPMTAVSTALQNAMRVQQTLTTLAIKGDEVLDGLFSKTEEQPQWATFDEDGDYEVAPLTKPAAPAGAHATFDDEPATPEPPSSNNGRFELYTTAPEDIAAATPHPPADIDAPAVVTALNYGSLTLAQLRARLQSLSLTQLQDLLTYEDATTGRAPFHTMLSNRIANVSAK